MPLPEESPAATGSDAPATPAVSAAAPLVPPSTVALSSWSALPLRPPVRKGRPRAPSLEVQLIARMRPEHRLIAEFRAKQVKIKQIAALLDYQPNSVVNVLRRPDVKAAMAFYSRSLQEKATAARGMAANLLPKALARIGDELEKKDLEPRHLINATNTLATLAGAKEEPRAVDRSHRVTINFLGDSEAGRQLAKALTPETGAGEEIAEVEWEEITPAAERPATDDADGGTA